MSIDRRFNRKKLRKLETKEKPLRDLNLGANSATPQVESTRGGLLSKVTIGVSDLTASHTFDSMSDKPSCSHSNGKAPMRSAAANMNARMSAPASGNSYQYDYKCMARIDPDGMCDRFYLSTDAMKNHSNGDVFELQNSVLIFRKGYLITTGNDGCVWKIPDEDSAPDVQKAQEDEYKRHSDAYKLAVQIKSERSIEQVTTTIQDWSDPAIFPMTFRVLDFDTQQFSNTVVTDAEELLSFYNKTNFTMERIFDTHMSLDDYSINDVSGKLSLIRKNQFEDIKNQFEDTKHVHFTIASSRGITEPKARTRFMKDCEVMLQYCCNYFKTMKDAGYILKTTNGPHATFQRQCFEMLPEVSDFSYYVNYTMDAWEKIYMPDDLDQGRPKRKRST